MSNSSKEISRPSRALPWDRGTAPLMPARRQGVTNRATRALFIVWVKPDVACSEFLRVSPVSQRLQLRRARSLSRFRQLLDELG